MLKSDQNSKDMKVYSFLATVFFLIPFIIFNSISVIIALFGIILCIEILLSIYEEEIHNNLESHNRATANSIVNLFSSLIATLTLNAFGFFNQYSGIKIALLFLAGTFFILLILDFIKTRFKLFSYK